MELTQLAALREVAQFGSVTDAAAVLRCTPSAVSQQLKALERSVGTPLVERVGRGVRLTQAGEALAAGAVDVAIAMERARAAADQYARRRSGTVTVTAFQSAAQLLFPDLLERASALDGIELVCSDSDVAQSEFLDLTAEHDIVIAHRPDRSAAFGPEVRTVPLLREPLDVAVPLAHPLAARDTVSAAELAGQRWIAVRRGFPLAEVLDMIAARSGSPAVIAHRINDFHVAEAMVAAGHGLALLPRYSATATAQAQRGMTAGYRLLPLTGIRAGRQIEALLRPDRHERVVVRQVLSALRELVGEVAAGAVRNHTEARVVEAGDGAAT